MKHINTKRGTFVFSRFMIGLVLFSLFMSSLWGLYYAFSSTYDVSTPDQFKASYNKIAKISNSSITVGQQLQGTKLQDTNTLVIAAQSIFAVGQIIISSISIPLELVAQLTSDIFHIPVIFVNALIAILTIAVFFGIVNLFARWNT